MNRTQDHKAPEISVILPVFNVAGYLDACMESVLAQTFADFEALLIDDGSTDGSGALCDSWAARDGRVRVFHKENGGVSSARNLGIEQARGAWLAFADPDDWLDLTYLEKLHTAAVESGADFAECDLWRVDGRNGTMIRRSCGGTMGVPWTREEHMIYGSTATYKAISVRSLWTDNGVRLPDCAFESPAVYALILALAKKTVNVPEALYYYRRFRPESLIETGYAHRDGSPNNTLGVEAMEHLLQEFHRLGLCGRYRDTLERTVKYRLSDILAMQFHRKRPEDLAETAANFRAFLRKNWPGVRNARYITWGGYNLSRILVHLPMLHEPQLRFGFSSLSSLAGEGGVQPAHHKNRYRELMLQREERRALLDCLEEVKPAFLFADLMEERFDLIERDGRIVTESDARQGAAERTPGRRIDRFGAEADALFEGACRLLKERLAALSPDTQVVLVESLLCGTVGDLSHREPFAEAEAVRADNELLARRYAQFAAVFPDAVRIRPAELAAADGTDLWFTDKGYEYGAIPSHVNEPANRKIAKGIQERLGL